VRAARVREKTIETPAEAIEEGLQAPGVVVAAFVVLLLLLLFLVFLILLLLLVVLV
jgi:hypothetical protein